MGTADFGSEAGVEFQTMNQVMNLQARFEERFALLLSEQLGDFRGVFLDEFARVQKRVATIFRRDIGPNLKSVFRGLDRLLHIFVIALWHRVDRRAGGGVAHFGSVLSY